MQKARLQWTIQLKWVDPCYLLDLATLQASPIQLMAADFRDETGMMICFHLSVPDQVHYTDGPEGQGFSVDSKDPHQLILPPIGYVSHEDRLRYRFKSSDFHHLYRRPSSATEALCSIDSVGVVYIVNKAF